MSTPVEEILESFQGPTNNDVGPQGRTQTELRSSPQWHKDWKEWSLLVAATLIIFKVPLEVEGGSVFKRAFIFGDLPVRGVMLALLFFIVRHFFLPN